MATRVLITGGFIESQPTDLLLHAGCEVRILDSQLPQAINVGSGEARTIEPRGLSL